MEKSHKQKFIQLLLDVADGERQIEILRQVLCEQEDFEPYAAFKRIDRSFSGLIGTSEITLFLADNEVFRSEDECYAFVRRYDIDRDNRLNYTEFLHAVLPVNNSGLRTTVTQRPNYEVKASDFLSYQVEYALTKMIDKYSFVLVYLTPLERSLLPRG